MGRSNERFACAPKRRADAQRSDLDYHKGAVPANSRGGGRTAASFRALRSTLPPSPSQVFTSASYSTFSLRLRITVGNVRSAATVPVAASPNANKVNFFKDVSLWDKRRPSGPVCATPSATVGVVTHLCLIFVG